MDTKTNAKEDLDQILEKFRRYKEEADGILERRFGKYHKPGKALKELRHEVGEQLQGFSVSQMLIEDRR